MLPLMTRFAHGHKPLDWLSPDLAASILFVVNLRGTRTAIHATVFITFQNQRSFSFPII
jgi:hypothetical protein